MHVEFKDEEDLIELTNIENETDKISRIRKYAFDKTLTKVLRII